jgi:hypothetical protein
VQGKHGSVEGDALPDDDAEAEAEVDVEGSDPKLYKLCLYH